jgi:conjugative relaxase-like TrwC/TraI family protein
MLRITHSDNPAAAVAYFDGALSRGDYYAAEAPGVWHGLCAARLGLIGTVERDTFAALMRNENPLTGERLTARTRENRRPGTDFTFNAPKGVSVLSALTDDLRIRDAFRDAVRDTMREIERDVKTRIRTNSRDDDRITGNLAWAEFLHTTARPIDGVPDPHLHTHAFVVNATWDRKEQRYKAVQLGDIVADRPYYEAVFHARLAHGMRQLGYKIERKGKFWDVAGLPDELLKSFSRRTAEIEAAAEELGYTSADAKASLGKRTRQRKTKELPPEQIRNNWQQRAGSAGRQAIAAVTKAAQRASKDHADISAKSAMDYALSDAFERASVATEKSIFAAALRRGFGDVMPETIRAAAETFELVTGMIDGRKVVTTRHILAEETRLIAFARAGRLACRPMAAKATIADTRLNAGQRKAVQQIWTSPDRVTAIKGGAGVGKTTLMVEAANGLTKAGHRVAVFAPTSAARDVLKSEGFSGAETPQRLLADERLQLALRDSVLWVDEAGLVSVPDMARLFDLAARLNARVILSGDPQQHSSVARGDALRIIAERAGIRPANVNEIVRQKGTYKEAVQALANGNVAHGWQLLKQMGAIHELPDETRIDRLAQDYLDAVEGNRTVLVVSPTHAEKDLITAAIRTELQSAGRLGDARTFTVWRELQWTEAQKSDPIGYMPGQWVRFTQNAAGIVKGAKLEVIGRDDDNQVLARNANGETVALPLAKAANFKVYASSEKSFAVGDLVRITENGRTPGGTFVNGAIHTVTGFDKQGNLILDKTKTLPKDYGAFDHGYASTSIAAQGRTVDTVLIAMGKASIPAMSQEQLYVSASRARTECHIYTDDADTVRQAVQRSSHRGSATELLEGQLDRKLKPLTEQSRSERLKAFSTRLAENLGRAARANLREATGLEREIDRDEIKSLRDIARQAMIAEYKGRVHERAAELGD